MLREYKDWLSESYSRETAETYYKRLCRLLAGQSVTDTVGKLDMQMVLDKLGEIKHKNYFSQCKNAFLRFCEFKNITLPSDVLENIKQFDGCTKKKYRKRNIIDYKAIDSAIKRIKKDKLRLSYQTAIATGLRVSELASISPCDCEISADEIMFSFIGKGGDQEAATVQAVEHPQLYQSVVNLIENTKTNKKVFYSAIYLQKTASELGFKCHDLRRICAKLEYKKCRNKGEVKLKLRHSNIKTTGIYLRSKVKF